MTILKMFDNPSIRPEPIVRTLLELTQHTVGHTVRGMPLVPVALKFMGRIELPHLLAMTVLLAMTGWNRADHARKERHNRQLFSARVT